MSEDSSVLHILAAKIASVPGAQICLILLVRPWVLPLVSFLTLHRMVLGIVVQPEADDADDEQCGHDADHISDVHGSLVFDGFTSVGSPWPASHAPSRTTA